MRRTSAASTRTEEHVHSSASVWCLLDQSGEQLERGRTPTTHPALRELASRLGEDDDLLAGHEVGGQVYLVHDAVTAAGVTIQAFNAAHLRMIAASRKKTDKHDAYWIAKALPTGMTPHAVYIPSGDVRLLRRLLARRRMVTRDRKCWQNRARAFLRSDGVKVSRGNSKIRQKVDEILEHPDGVRTELLDSLGLCERSISLFGEECADIVFGTRTSSLHTRAWCRQSAKAVALRSSGTSPKRDRANCVRS